MRRGRPDQAADVIAKAVIERPRTLEPPWVLPASSASVKNRRCHSRAARSAGPASSTEASSAGSER
ncbi:hypothetical protein MAHJHV54_49120 [Mycobacterium avium subsp. hominissuis]